MYLIYKLKHNLQSKFIKNKILVNFKRGYSENNLDTKLILKVQPFCFTPSRNAY